MGKTDAEPHSRRPGAPPGDSYQNENLTHTNATLLGKLPNSTRQWHVLPLFLRLSNFPSIHYNRPLQT